MRVSALRVAIVAASVYVPCDERSCVFSELLNLVAALAPRSHRHPTVLGAVKDKPSAALNKRRP